MDVSNVVSWATIVCAAVVSEHFLSVQDGAARDIDDFGPGWDAADRTVHGECASDDDVSDSGVWGEGVFVESGAVQYEGARADFDIR